MIEITKVVKYLNKTKWYHGTTLWGWQSICSLGVKYDFNIGYELDFGYGFYLTHDKRQAEYYISNVLKYNIDVDLGMTSKNIEAKRIPVIMEFEFCPSEWYYENKYKFRILNEYNDEFAEFVFFNRVDNLNGDKFHGYDIIFGVMSDSKPTVLIQKYKNSEISKEYVIEELKKTTSNKQISLHNQELCDRIKLVRVYLLNTGEELDINAYNNK